MCGAQSKARTQVVQPRGWEVRAGAPLSAAVGSAHASMWGVCPACHPSMRGLFCEGGGLCLRVLA